MIFDHSAVIPYKSGQLAGDSNSELFAGMPLGHRLRNCVLFAKVVVIVV